MEIWTGVFPRCSKMLYCGPNEDDSDGDALSGGGLDGAQIGGPTILSRVRRVATAHWVSGPLMLMTLMDGSTHDMQLIRIP